jgi:hypothetical protein
MTQLERASGGRAAGAWADYLRRLLVSAGMGGRAAAQVGEAEASPPEDPEPQPTAPPGELAGR